MKKFLTALSGLLFLAGIILVAGGCEAACNGRSLAVADVLPRVC